MAERLVRSVYDAISMKRVNTASATLEGAILAAVRRVLMGEAHGATIYDNRFGDTSTPAVVVYVRSTGSITIRWSTAK